ncbi:MAG: AsmA-like C-terminal region-containing protein, partial [Bacteroidota bacterium]
GKLNVTSGKATLEKNRFRSMGGTVSLDGIVDGSDARVVDLDADLKTKDVHLDSLFYVFEDFNQQFITARHLRGQVTSDITLRARLTPELELVQDWLVADLSLLIRKGELNDFEPILKLNKYLDDSGLRKLRFADLKNDIHIQDKTVFIPRMEIRSNLTTIQLSGKHTFDQHIDYRIVAPITGRRNINREEAGTAFVEDKGGQSKLYLKITGTTDNYQVGYDMAAVKEKISGQIRQEIKSLKESFKVKPKEPKKKLEIAEDEFFEWENEQ